MPGLLGLLDLISAPSPEQARGLLSDLVAAPRNRLRGLLDNPIGFANDALQEGLFGPPEVRAARDKFWNKEPMTEWEKQAYTNQLLNMGLAGLTVYHGSPHKFDKFDMSKIGTGEGAQAYGHGLYMAETPDVANTYKMSSLWSNTPADQLPYLVNGKAYKPSNIDEAQILHSMTKNDVEMLHSLESNYSRLANPSTKTGKHYQEMLSRLKELQGSKVEPGVGYLYKVDLPDESIAKMLDWDKPLSQQPNVLKAIAQAQKNNPDLAAPWMQGNYLPSVKNMTGREAYNAMAQGAATSGKQYKTGADVSNELAKYGVPGIRYLDGGSRNAGQGTYNYVVFDDTLPTILERNGQKLK